MTSGNKTYSALVAGVATEVFTNQTTPVQSGTLKTRVWSGGDSIIKSRSQGVDTRTVHVLDTDGTRIQVTYDPARKRKLSLAPNPYECVFVEDKQPTGVNYTKTIVTSTGGVYNQNYWSNSNTPALHGGANHLPSIVSC